MPYRDLDEFIARLEQNGELLSSTTPVSSDLEIAEIVRQLYALPARKTRALLFENVLRPDGARSAFPVLVNLFGSERRMAWALGGDTLDDLTARMSKLLDPRIPASFADLMARAGELLGALRSAGSIGGSRTRIAPAQEMVITTGIDLGILPALRFYPEEPYPTLTLAAVITRHPQTGVRNAGMYPVHVLDSQRLAIRWDMLSGGRAHAQAALEAGQERLPVALALGGDPAVMWSAAVPMPPGVDETMLAGFLRGRALEFARCLSQPLDIPANADIIIEGWVNPRETLTVGPFAERSGFYSASANAAVMHVTTITHRRNAVFPVTVFGKPGTEWSWMHRAQERLFLPVLQVFMGEISDIDFPAEGLFHNLAIVSIRKLFDGHPQKALFGLWGIGATMYTRTVLVVDDDVNVHDYAAVARRLAESGITPEDVLLARGIVRGADHNSTQVAVAGKLGVDATRKAHPVLYRVPSAPDGDALQAAGAIAWRMWGSNLLVVQAEDAAPGKEGALLHHLRELAPDFHLLLVDRDSRLDDLPGLVWRVLSVIDWSRDVSFSGGLLTVNAAAAARYAALREALPDPAVQKRVRQKWLQYGVE